MTSIGRWYNGIGGLVYTFLIKGKLSSYCGSLPTKLESAPPGTAHNSPNREFFPKWSLWTRNDFYYTAQVGRKSLSIRTVLHCSISKIKQVRSPAYIRVTRSRVLFLSRPDFSDD